MTSVARLPFFGPLALSLAALTALAVAVSWRSSGGGIASPGALSGARGAGVVRHGVRSHADLSRRCAACHAAPWAAQTTSDNCLRCHDEVRLELRARRGLHGRIARGSGCLAGCHTEHRGRSADLTQMDVSSFRHETTGFSLSAHREVRPGHAFACPDCHDRGRWQFDEARCSGCHAADDIHHGAFGTKCADCHDGTAWKPALFDHSRTSYPLTGAHARTACDSCHEGGRLAGTPRECSACHEEPADHRGTFGPACADCHDTESWRNARLEHRFPLDHGGEGRIACRTCHPSSWRQYTCMGCHEHSAERVAHDHREEGLTNLDDCVRCHPTGREHEGQGGHEGGGDEHGGGHREDDEEDDD